MQRRPEMLHWGAIATAPEQPGIYAWYYTPRFTAFDRRALEEALELEPTPGLIDAFLDRHLFKYFKETPYAAIIRGPLKATYVGELIEERSVTPQLTKRLAEDGARRSVLWDALEAMTPYFAAPLYIGMTKNLRSRLRQHKSLIEGGLERQDTAPAETGRASRDAGFASEVVRRGLPTERLSVYTLTLPTDAGPAAADVENLLNRVNYPILGRN